MVRRSKSMSKPVVSTFVALGLLFGAAACAPEPGDAAGLTDKDTETINPETEWGGRDVTGEELTTELPPSFPNDIFTLPEGVTIYNAGERGEGQWFVVLIADGNDAAKLLWDDIIATNAFEVIDEVETSEGGVSATLANASLNVQALTIPQADGTVQMSYNLVRQV